MTTHQLDEYQVRCIRCGMSRENMRDNVEPKECPEFRSIETLAGESVREACERLGITAWIPPKEPDPIWPIRRFAVWWLRTKPIQQSAIPVRILGCFMGVTLYREPPFQVQLWSAPPHATAPRHAHPNVDSIEWHVAGQSEFISERNASFAGLMHIEPGEWHTAKAGPAGASFLSIQKWLNGVAPSSVDLDWDGPVIDSAHAWDLKAKETA